MAAKFDDRRLAFEKGVNIILKLGLIEHKVITEAYDNKDYAFVKEEMKKFASTINKVVDTLEK